MLSAKGSDLVDPTWKLRKELKFSSACIAANLSCMFSIK